MRTLSEHAHGMYQVHGVFVIWRQCLLSGTTPLAVGKAGIVRDMTLALSWATTALICRAPVGARIPGAQRPVLACAS